MRRAAAIAESVFVAAVLIVTLGMSPRMLVQLAIAVFS